MYVLDKPEKIEKGRMEETVKGREIYKILGTKNHLFTLRATPHFYKSAGESRSSLSMDKDVSKISVIFLDTTKISFIINCMNSMIRILKEESGRVRVSLADRCRQHSSDKTELYAMPCLIERRYLNG
jgi:hypothetical protein